MQRFVIVAVLVIAVASLALAQAQMTPIAEHNAYVTKNNPSIPADSLRPYEDDQGVRTIWLTEDMDKDGKPEILATDYSNGGRIHVFEYSGDTLELVWSSPSTKDAPSSASVPRWVRDGDLDGDGNREIVFPLGIRYEGEIQVWEYNGADNDYGTSPAIVLPTSQFTGSGLLRIRLDRETGTVEDLDGDGRDELISANEDHKVYIFGVAGDFPGFGAWQIEGGDPAVHPENRFSGGSWWHSLPVDIDGDGTKEIVNHYWNYYGFWSIDPLGPDSYRYPAPVAESKTNHYFEYMKSRNEDATAYMGVQPLDVDGDNKEEIAGILYIGGSPFDYQVTLVSLASTDTGVYVWRDSTQFGIIGTELWKLAGKTAGSHWGIAAHDFNGNGRDELLLGGSADYNIIAMEYKGTGSVVDGNNYDKTIYYPGDPAFYHEWTYTTDSLGNVDTSFAESPFVSKMWAASDLNNNGKNEVLVVYQSVADSILYTYRHWDTTQTPTILVTDSTRKTPNSRVITIRVMEYQGTSDVATRELTTITPDDYTLAQNYPNPFNPSTTIRFSLPIDKKISLVVYDMLGREVKTLIGDQNFRRGAYEVSWDGTDNFNRPVASGNYIYTLKFGNFSKSAKMTLLK